MKKNPNFYLDRRTKLLYGKKKDGIKRENLIFLPLAGRNLPHLPSLLPVFFAPTNSRNLFPRFEQAAGKRAKVDLVIFQVLLSGNI